MTKLIEKDKNRLNKREKRDVKNKNQIQKCDKNQTQKRVQNLIKIDRQPKKDIKPIKKDSQLSCEIWSNEPESDWVPWSNEPKFEWIPWSNNPILDFSKKRGVQETESHRVPCSCSNEPEFEWVPWSNEPEFEWVPWSNEPEFEWVPWSNEPEFEWVPWSNNPILDFSKERGVQSKGGIKNILSDELFKKDKSRVEKEESKEMNFAEYLQRAVGNYRKKLGVNKRGRKIKRLIKVKPKSLVKKKNVKTLKKKYHYDSLDDVQFGPKGDKFQYSDYFKKQFLQTRFKRLKRVFYWMVLRPTMSNMFVYVYRLRFNKMKKLRSRKRQRRFMTASLGMLGYKGNAKTSDIALKTLGIYIGRKMKYYGIDCINLILRSRVSRRYKHFFKGFRESRISVRYIYVLPKFAHNGCRLKKRRK